MLYPFLPSPVLDRIRQIHSLLIPPSFIVVIFIGPGIGLSACTYSIVKGRVKNVCSFPAKRIFLSYHDVINTYFDRFDTRTAGKIRFFCYPASIQYIDQGSDHG